MKTTTIKPKFGKLKLNRMHISILGGIFFLILAAKFLLMRYEVLFSTQGVVFGAAYTDLNITMPVFMLYSIVAVIAALAFFAHTRFNIRPLLIVAAFVAIMFIGGLAGVVVQKLIVEPDEFNTERQYIERNIDYTLKAYKLDGAEIAIVSMGSVVGTIKELIDRLEEEGKKVGLLQICSYRPFPRHEVYNALKDKLNIVVLEKCISLGRGGILASDVRWSFPRAEKKDRNISSFVAGLGGRNIALDDLRYMVEKVEREPVEFEFLGLKEELIAERDM